MVGYPTLDEEVVVLVNCCEWNGIDGTAELLGSSEQVEIDGLKAVALHDVLCVGLLGEETQEGAVLVR